MIVIARGSVFAIELKVLGGRVTPTQVAVHERLRKAGARVATAYGIDEAIAQLEAWGLLRGRGVIRAA